MKTGNIEERLQNAYHQMVETVGDLIKKEKQPLMKATQTAQDKVSEWGEFTREEIDKVSDEVQHDIASIGLVLDNAREAFKEKLAFDGRYLKEATFDKLSEIAEHSSLELAEFSAELREQALGQTQAAHQDVHQEHISWESDHLMWLSDIRQWEQEHVDALDKLDVIAAKLKSQEELVAEHKQVVRAHQAREHDHEADMARVEQDSSNENAQRQDTVDTGMHAEMRALHEKHALLHQQLKRKHREVIALIDRLGKQ